MNSIQGCFVLCSIIFTANSKSIPSFLERCTQNDPSLDACIIKSINDLKPNLGPGIPNMRIPAFDPLVISELDLNSPTFEVHFTNMLFNKAQNFDIEELHLDIEQNSMHLVVNFPFLNQRGIYRLKGKILVLQLDGTGDFEGNYTNIHMDMQLTGERTMKRNKEYLNFNANKMILKLGDAVVRLDDIFKGNQELTDNANAMFMQSRKELIPTLEPSIAAAMQNVMLSIINNVFISFPLEELLPKN